MFWLVTRSVQFKCVCLQLRRKSWMYVGSCRLFSEEVHSIAKPKQQTLEEKFVNYFRTNNKYKLYTVHAHDCDMKNIYSENQKDVLKLFNELFSQIGIEQFPYFLYNLNVQKDVLSSSDLQSVLMLVDKKCCEHMHHMNKPTVLKCLDAWYNLCPDQITAKKFYTHFTSAAMSWLSNNSTVEEVVYLMFYVGMQKKNLAARKIMNQCLKIVSPQATSLSLDELSIVVSSSYKTSIKMNPQLLQYICNIININLDAIISDPSYLVTFVKGFRLAKCHDFTFMDQIANKHYKDVLEMNFIAKVHLLALYADALYDKAPFTNSLIQSCISDIIPIVGKKTDYLVLRFKDISRFLWAVSYLGYTLSHESLVNTVSQMQSWVAENHHLKNPEHIVSSLLSLWILNEKVVTLFRSAITEDLMEKLQEKKLFRSSARLSLLLTCIRLENPEILRVEHTNWSVTNKIPPRAVQKQLENRATLQQLFTAVTHLCNCMNLRALCECHIPNLNIIGISVISTTGKILHIEVLDSTVCLRNSHTPHGLMKLKLRLLKSLGHRLLVVRDDKFIKEDLSNMYVFLEEELQKLVGTTGISNGAPSI